MKPSFEDWSPEEAFISHLDKWPAPLAGGGDARGQAGSAHAVDGALTFTQWETT